MNKTIFRILVGKQCYRVRNFLLTLFGAKLDNRCLIYPSCTIFAPWNLEVGFKSCIGPRVNLYNKAKLVIGDNVVISQESEICTASHDIESHTMNLIKKDICIKNKVWICSQVFIGPGVTIGEGSVIGARGVIFKDVNPWEVWCGNPAKFVKKRIITNER
ncbi:MAG: putative colanic acid biosynthesis acetyltransferase [Opitutae bacterium]|nr:putative colanic acid biosynthesis acetyltransferase [Opitutae bacterium]